MKIGVLQQNVNFLGKFKINDIDGLECAYCKRAMISRKSIDKLFGDVKDEDKLFLDIAKENVKYLKPFQQDILNFLSRVQTDTQFISDEFILDEAKHISSKEVRKDLSEKFDDIADVIMYSNCKAIKRKLEQRGEDLRELLMKNRRYETLNGIVYGERRLGIHKHWQTGFVKAINEIVDDSGKMEYSIFGYVLDKVRAFSAKDFYKELFSQSESTIEHLVPRSHNGADTISNYLAVCRKCNSDRLAMSFPLYLKYNPQAKENIVHQIRELKRIIPELIAKRKLPEKYKNYPEKVKKTIRHISNHEIDFKG